MDVKGVQAGSLTEYRADWEKMLWISVNSYLPQQPFLDIAVAGFVFEIVEAGVAQLLTE